VNGSDRPSVSSFERVAVITGAGISAESGIPLLGDDPLGFWNQFDLAEMATVEGWQRNPSRVWASYLWLNHLLQFVQPNEGHHALAAWQEHSEVTVITQNHDDLHERAGSRTVHHVHGSINDFRCDTCAAPYRDPIPDMPAPESEKAPPACGCGGRVRPGIVWFSELIPENSWRKAIEAITTADLLVVVGCSGMVHPVADLPRLALESGAVVVEVNPEPTPLSSFATITLREKATDGLPGLLGRLAGLLP